MFRGFWLVPCLAAKLIDCTDRTNQCSYAVENRHKDKKGPYGFWQHIDSSSVRYDGEIKRENGYQRYSHSDTQDAEYDPGGLAKPVTMVNDHDSRSYYDNNRCYGRKGKPGEIVIGQHRQPGNTAIWFAGVPRNIPVVAGEEDELSCSHEDNEDVTGNLTAPAPGG